MQTMPGDSNYCYEGTENFFIENGVLIGHKEPYLREHSSYGELVLKILRAQPEFVGQVNGVTGKEETFAEMMTKSVKCAIWLKEQGVKQGDVIGICTYNQMDMYVPCLAALFIGAVFNPWWDAGLTKEVTKHFLDLTRPKMVFVSEAAHEIITEVMKNMGINAQIVVFGKFPGQQSLDDIYEAIDDKRVTNFQCTKLSSVDDLAVIIYTSGTTGLPKGAAHSHRSLFGNLNLVEKLGDEDKIATSMIFSPLSWLTGVLLMFRGIVGREKRIIYPEFIEEKTCELIEKFKVNWMLMGTSMAFRFQKTPTIPNYDLSSLKFIYVGGGVLKKEIQKDLADTFPGAGILQAYGSTELGGVAIQQAPDFKPGSCGRLVKNLTMKVVDIETSRILGPNETGEACFKSPFRFSNYYRNPEGTKGAIDSEGWFHSGDIVHYDEEGHVFVTDRIKEMIKYRGFHVSPALIEQVIQIHPGIREIAVIGIAHDIDDEHPLAFVSKTKNSAVTKEEIEKMMAEKLPDYMNLRGGIMFLDDLPHTASGKVARTELKKLARSYAQS